MKTKFKSTAVHVQTSSLYKFIYYTNCTLRRVTGVSVLSIFYGAVIQVASWSTFHDACAIQLNPRSIMAIRTSVQTFCPCY